MKTAAQLCREPDRLLAEGFIKLMTNFDGDPAFLRWLVGGRGSPVYFAGATYQTMTITSHAQWIRLLANDRPLRRQHVGRGGRHRSHLTLEAECAFFDDLERRAEAGAVMSVATIVREVVELAGHAVSERSVRAMLQRQGFIRVGTKPAWERREEYERRKHARMHRERLEQEPSALAAIAPPGTAASDEDDDSPFATAGERPRPQSPNQSELEIEISVI